VYIEVLKFMRQDYKVTAKYTIIQYKVKKINSAIILTGRVLISLH